MELRAVAIEKVALAENRSKMSPTNRAYQEPLPVQVLGQPGFSTLPNFPRPQVYTVTHASVTQKGSGRHESRPATG